MDTNRPLVGRFLRVNVSGGISIYQAIGGKSTCRKLSVALYAGVATNAVLRPLFPGKSFKCAIDEFTAFLVQFLGGPADDTQKRWWLSLRESHLRFRIGGGERAAWLSCMATALDEVMPDPAIRAALLTFFQESSSYIVNHGERNASAAEDTRPSEPRAELSKRWNAQLRLDELVAAIRAGNVENATALAESEVIQRLGSAVKSGVLSLMVRSEDSAMLAYVHSKLTTDPELVVARHAGRTLLHVAAGAGCVATVELLLSLHADPNVCDEGGHRPLYYAGNECGSAAGAQVVRALVRSGAVVDADDGVKRCTPLHMAARRGHIPAGQALVECGAKLEARDSASDTPLRRAVNCNQVEFAAMLLAHGADAHSVGSNAKTPALAARSEEMRQLLRSRNR